ncbi:MAG: TonB-dependent receptor [Alistipes sp.]
MKHLRLFTLTVAMALLFASTAIAQTLRGTVTDQANKQPLPGATMIVTGTNAASVTNRKGEYTINAKAGDVISVSFLGYQETTFTVGKKSVYDVELSATTSAIDDVVIVGYSLIKKSDLTGSSQSVKSSDLMKSRPTSIEQGMQGRLAGVNVVRNDGAPGGGISVQIRGTNSFMGSTEPLYVIDGVPMSTSNEDETISFDENEVQSRNALSFLDPNDIESIEVLKDASATAIYGSRGSNGVVMVTTKSGQKGKARLNFNASMTIGSVANKLRMLTGAEYADYRNQAYINTQLLTNGSYSPIGLPYLGDIGALGSYVKGPEDFNNDPYYWQNAIFHTAVSQNYNINYSGVTNNGDYAIGLSYLNQKGTVINSGYDRITANIKLNQNIRSWLKIGTSTNISMANSKMIKTATSNQNNGDEGVIRSALYFPSIYEKEDEPGYEEYQLVSNPIDYTEALNSNKNYNIYSSNYANATILRGLIFRTLFSYKASLNFTNRYFPKSLYEGRSVGGKSLAGDNQSQTYLWDNMLMFNRTFGKHNISATAGLSWESFSYYSKQVATQGFGYDGNDGWILGDGTNPQTPKSVKQDATLFSLIARAAYNYRSTYYFTVTFRRDASSKFARNNKAAYFPSVGIAWRAKGERFLQNSKAISNLKFRYSYGASGNAGIGPYGSLLLFGNANYPFGSNILPGYAVEGTNPGNPNLKWETTYQHDLGIDISLFDKVDMELDYYHKTTSDLIQKKELSPSTGKTSVLSNIGKVMNEGIEFSVSYNILQNKDWQLRIGGNIAFNRNRVTDIGGADQQIFPNNLWNDLRPFIIKEGRPIGQLYGYIEQGIWSTREEVINSKVFQTTYKDYTAESNDPATETIIRQKWLGEVKIYDKDDNGVINDKDQDYIGNVNPKLLYGFNINVGYKGFDLSVLFNGVYGNDIINMSSLRFHNLGQTRNVLKSVLDQAWTPTNGGTSPKIYTTNGRDLYFSRRYIEDGSYLKLRNLSLGYTYKPKSSKIGTVRIYVSMNNLWTITNYSGYDPEVNAFGSNPSSRGVDAGGYPQSREYTFGINFTL